jgi:uncharacterized coiled-coil protein SlyX
MTANERRLTEKCAQQASQIRTQEQTIDRLNKAAVQAKRDMHQMRAECERVKGVNARLRRDYGMGVA